VIATEDTIRAYDEQAAALAEAYERSPVDEFWVRFTDIRHLPSQLDAPRLRQIAISHHPMLFGGTAVVQCRPGRVALEQ
jgi:hypothetical protein